MRCNWRRWLWGVIPIMLLGWIAAQMERGPIEQDLADRAGVALNTRGSGWAVVAFEGRDVVLSGRAPDEGEPARAAEALGRLWGVRTVKNGASLLEKADNYVWSASRRGQNIRLYGYAPSLATRQVVLGVAKANFPGFEIIDRTRLARGVPALDTWLAGISFGLRQLASLKRGDIRLESLNLSVTGIAEDLTEYRSVQTALQSGVPKGIKLASSNVLPPKVSPYKWSAKLASGQLVLSGYIPDDSGRSELLAAVKASSANVAIEDRMQPASGALQGMSHAAGAAIGALVRLENGNADISDATVTVSGLAPDAATLGAVRTALRTGLPEPFKLVDRLKGPVHIVVEPPPPLPPPPPELLPSAIPSTSSLPNAPSPPAGRPGSEMRLAIPPPPPLPPPPPELVPPAARQMAASERPAPPAPPAPIPQAVPAPPKLIVPPTDITAEARASACQEVLTGIAQAGQIRFAVGSAELDRASLPTLDHLVDAAKACPGLRIEIAGHASSEGSAAINQQLSNRRAHAVVSYLVKAGVEAKHLEATGYGATRPIAPNDTEENMARNRRIEFVVRPMK